MAFTLEDLLALPDDVQPEHAAKAGLTVPPPPTPAPGPQPPAPIAAAAPAPAAPAAAGPPAPIIPIDGNKFFKGVGAHPHAAAAQPMPGAPDIQPDFSSNAGLGAVEATDDYTKLPSLNFKQRMNLSRTSPGVGANTPQYYDNELQREQEKDRNPWGSADNHPGWLGKVGHVAAKIGNIAGDIVDPGAMALIPETDLGHRLQEKNLFTRGQEAESAELAKQAEGVKERQEDTREQHEENYRQHQLEMEQQGNEKINALFEGLTGKEKKTANDKEKWLRGFGLKNDPDNPDGAPIEIPQEDLSPKEHQQMSLMQAMFHARQAKAAYDEYKADPTNPQAQAALMRARAAQTQAGAAAQRAGIESKKFLADYVGTDENGQPLAGVELTGDGRPVGVKVAGAAGKGVTNTTRSMAEMARTVQPQIEKVQKEVQDLSASIGPAAGRWNDLMTNKGGADFPEFAGLDQDLDLLASAVVRTHFGARGGQDYRKALRANFGEAQSPEDLLARINAASSWIQGYAQADQAGGKAKRHVGDNPTTPKPGGTPEKIDPNNPPDGAIRVHRKSGQQDKYDAKTKTWQPIQNPAAAQQ